MDFLKKILLIFLERGREGEREEEKHQCVVASCMPPTRDLACNPGMCPDWESHWRPFGSQASPQSTEPYQPGPFGILLLIVIIKMKITILKKLPPISYSNEYKL